MDFADGAQGGLPQTQGVTRWPLAAKRWVGARPLGQTRARGGRQDWRQSQAMLASEPKSKKVVRRVPHYRRHARLTRLVRCARRARQSRRGIAGDMFQVESFGLRAQRVETRQKSRLFLVS